MKNFSHPSALIESIDFLKLIGTSCLGGGAETTTEGFIFFLRTRIFPGLGPVSAEIYFSEDNGEIFDPFMSHPPSKRIVSTAVPPRIILKDGILEGFHIHRRYRVFTENDDNLPFVAVADMSHALFPLFMGERLAAILYVGSKALPTFPEDYLLGLESLAHVIDSQLERLETLAYRKKSAVISDDWEQLQQALYDISEQAHQMNSEDDLYRSVHEIVGRLINARNFFIALRHKRDDEHYIKFVYYCDEFDSYLQGMEFKIDPKEKLSMSAFLVQNGKPVLLGPDIFDEFCASNGIQPLGTKAHSLVGVPFYLEHLAGVVLVQNYHHEVYTEKDKDLLVYVARHIGDALARKKAIDDLRETNEIFSLFLRYSPVHVYIKEVQTDESRIVMVSENYKISPYTTSAELIGKTMSELFPAEFAAKTIADDRQVISSGVPLQTEDYLDGRTYTTIKFPIVRGGKSLLAGYSIDITELKLHEIEQQRIEKLESLGVLAGGIAHDFNNILTGIMGNISFLQVVIDGGHQAHHPLAEAEKATRRAAELAQQLLTFARGGAPNKKVIRLQRLARDAASLMLRGSNVRVVINITDSLHAIQADEGQISQVLNNLIINASQAMPGGGTLTITAENETLPEDTSFGLGAGTYVKMRLSDEGCGISQENLGKIFDPYFSTKATGTGLGLATTYSILLRHNGHIRVNSTVGQGTTFTLYLPSVEASSQGNTPVALQKCTDHAGGSVLIMDDEKMIRDLAAAMLSHLGYAVTTCVSGEEAIELYRVSMRTGTPYTAVILDLTIPGGIGGKQTAELLLALAPDAYLIVSSGYSNDPIMANYQDFGFRGAIAKPYDISQFGEVLGAISTPGSKWS